MSSLYSSDAIRRSAEDAPQILGSRQMKPQLGVVESFLAGHDVFGVLPTGSGKSLLCLPPHTHVVFTRFSTSPRGLA